MPARQATHPRDIYRQLKDMILGFYLYPGVRITENELAARFGVSRTPVREALQRLAAEGYVTIRPKQGCFVTDIAGRAEFSHRAEKPGGGARHWRIDQLLGSEVDQLRARQAFAGRDLSFDGQFAIPRFEQVVALARKQWLSGRQLGVYPEIKHPDELRREGIDATGLLINALRRLHVAGHDSPVWVQCFERWPLDQVRQDCGNKVFALFEASHRTRGNWLQRLHQESPWLDGIALPKSMLIGPHRQVGLSAAAHELGWQVHVYTLRDDSVATGFASVEEEFSALFAEGVDAVRPDGWTIAEDGSLYTLPIGSK